jgi:DNA invertase Pin-like site-specific DNA recombinase
MVKAAIYARYSSVLQDERSIEDQIRLCRENIARDKGTVVDIYTDYAISGGSLRNRPGMQTLLADAKSGIFDAVVAEALDRSQAGCRLLQSPRNGGAVHQVR